MATMDEKSESKEMKEEEPKQMSCFAKFKSAFSLTQEGATPPNWRIISIMIFSMFGSAYSLTYIFPFLPSMILYFGYEEEDKGYYAGFVASAMFAGRIVGSYFWGWLSDKKGRKPVIILNLILISLANLGFAFSTTLAEAILWRFINGVINGLVGVCKTVLYETSDNTNQAVGISTLSLAWGSGVILGPLISGHLAEPADLYDSLKDSTFLLKYPYFLPAFIACIVATLPIFVCLFFLEETSEKVLAKKKKSVVDKQSNSKMAAAEDAQDEMTPMKSPALPHDTSFGENITDLEFIDGQDPHKRYGSSNLVYGLGFPSYSVGDLTGDIHYENELRKSMASLDRHCRDRPAKTDRLVKAVSASHVELKENGVCKIAEEEEDIVIKDEKKSCCERYRELGCVKILSERDVCLVVVLFSVVSFAYIGLEEVMTVWVSTDPQLGGLGFTSEQIGNALGLSSLPLIFVQIFLFTFFERRFGSLKIFCFANLYLIVFSVGIVCLRPLHDKPSALWPSILTLFAIQKLSGIMCFSASSLLINNSVHPSQAGSVNGLAMTLTSIGRTLGPTVGGSMYAWSISEGVKIGFPFDINFVFITFGLTFLSASIVAAFVPKHLERQTKK